MPKPPNRENSAQGAFLDWMISSGVLVDVFMGSGLHLQGVVAAFDEYAVLLRSPNGKKERLVLKMEISTVRPKAVPEGEMERPIMRRRRNKHRPLESFKHPIED